MANRTYTVIINRQGASGNNTNINFPKINIGDVDPIQTQLPAYYDNYTFGNELRAKFTLTDKSTSDLIDDGLSNVVIKLYNGETLLATSNTLDFGMPWWTVDNWDNDVVSILDAMTQAQIEACSLNVQFDYDGVTNEFESNLNYYDLSGV